MNRQSFSSKYVLKIGAAALALVTLGSASPVVRQTATTSDVPDLSGVWQGPYTPSLTNALGRELPYTPYGLERSRTVDHAQDPTGRCLPAGPTRLIQAPFPFRIIQTPGLIVLAFEYQRTYRLIFTDGRDHPEEVYEFPEFMGHSIGRWEADALVVETVGIKEQTWLDTSGHEHSDQFRLIERFQRVRPDTIEWSATFEDPVFFTEPFTVKLDMDRRDYRVMDYSCNENNRDVEHLVPTFGILR